MRSYTQLITGMTDAERQLLALAQDPTGWAALKPRQQTPALGRSDKGEFRTRFCPLIPGIYTVYVAMPPYSLTGFAGEFSKCTTTQPTCTPISRSL